MGNVRFRLDQQFMSLLAYSTTAFISSILADYLRRQGVPLEQTLYALSQGCGWAMRH